MVFIIIVFCVLIAWIFVAILASKRGWRATTMCSWIVAMLNLALFLISLSNILDENYFQYKEKREILEMERAPLAYMIDNGEIDGNLAVAIGEFNTELSTLRTKHDSIWNGWSVGGYVYDVDYLTLPKTKILK